MNDETDILTGLRWGLGAALIIWLLAASLVYAEPLRYIIRVTYRCPGHWSYATFKAKTPKEALETKRALVRFYGSRLGSIVVYRGVK